MKHNKKIVSSIFLFVIFSLYGFAQEQRFTFDPASKVWFEGTSTVHDFTCAVTKIEGTAVVDMKSASAGLKTLHVTIPVVSIKSGKDGMDENLYEALNEEDHHSIIYELYAVDLVKTEADIAIMNASGTLTINGTTKPVTISVRGKSIGEGKMQLEGSKTLLMTDFGVEPPTMFLGTVRTGDAVTVKFNIIMKQNMLEAKAG